MKRGRRPLVRRALAIATASILSATAAGTDAGVILRDRQSAITATAFSGFGCCEPTLALDSDPKFTNANAPDFSPFNESVDAAAAKTIDDRPLGGQTFFSGNSTGLASQNSRLDFDGTTLELFSASASAQASATATGSGNIFNAGSTGSGSSRFNLIFDVTGAPVNYTLSGSVLESPVSTSSQVSLARVNLPPGAFNRFPQVLGIIHDFDLDLNPPGAFDFGGQLSIGTYQLLAEISSPAASPNNPAGSASFNLDLVFTEVVVPAAEIRWINPVGGSFTDSSNWSPQQVPEKSVTRTDTAVFDLNDNYAVDLNAPRTVERLVVRAGRVDFNGNIVTAAATSPTVPSVSIENAARLSIATGGLRSVHAIIGNAPPADPANPPTAEVLVANLAQAQWINTGNLAVGGAGKGRLFIANGGFVESGSATIGGPFGGEAVVGGEASRWKAGNLAIGFGGDGLATLTIEARGEVVSGTTIIGSAPDSLAEVTVTGGIANDRSLLDVIALTVGGAGATGHLNVLAGGLVSAGPLIVADGPGSRGIVTVSGAPAGVGGSILSTLTMFLGRGGDTATMSVEDGGIVLVGSSLQGTISNLHVAVSSPAELFITGAGSQVSVTGDVNVGTSGERGLVSLNGGRMTVGGTLTVGADGEIRGIGALAVPQANRVVRNGGRIAPGLSPGRLVVEGDYEQTATGLLDVEIGGAAPGRFDVLEIAGDATLGGTLQLAFIDGFAPRAGDVFAFLDVEGTLAGAFADVDVLNLQPGFEFRLQSGGSGLSLIALNDGVVVPEPGLSTVLLVSGLVLLRRRQGRSGRLDI